jgi:hypothetical protein
MAVLVLLAVLTIVAVYIVLPSPATERAPVKAPGGAARDQRRAGRMRSQPRR